MVDFQSIDFCLSNKASQLSSKALLFETARQTIEADFGTQTSFKVGQGDVGCVQSSA